MTDFLIYTVFPPAKKIEGCARDDETRMDYLTFPFIPLRELTSAPSGHLLPEEGGSSLFPYHRFPRIVISSAARNLSCTLVRQKMWESGKHRTPYDLE